MTAVGDDLVITGIGMRCAVGQDAVQSCAAVRAGVARFREWPWMADPNDDEGGAIVAAAVVPALGNCHWMAKFQDLLTGPLLESLGAAGLSGLGDTDTTRWGIYLAIPPLDRPGIEGEDAEEFLGEIENNTQIPCEPASIGLVSNGHAGALLALQRAGRALKDDRLDVCVVSGVDSLLETEFLAHLMEERKLKTEANPVGLVPGEAAACVVVETAGHAQMRGARALARVTPVRSGIETAPASGTAPGRADVMAAVLGEAAADAPCGAAGIQRIINDLNGERWRFLEWAMAEARALTGVAPHRQLWHPADCFGDIGAASGAAHLCMAVRAFERAYAVGEAILVSNASDGGERAATVVLPPRAHD